MEKVLLYFAISLCFVATLSYFWRAFNTSSLWGWLSVLLPPVSLIYYAVYWEKSRRQACFHIVAFSLMLLSTVLAVRANPTAFDSPLLAGLRSTFAPASFGELLLLEDQRFPSKKYLSEFNLRHNGRLGGEIAGQFIAVEEVTLIDGVIRFTRGQGFYAEKQVSIALGDDDFFGESELSSNDKEGSLFENTGKKRLNLLVTPDDAEAPHIYLLTKNVDEAVPEIDIVESGYWMDLTLERGAYNSISGHVRLLLPGSKNSFLMGYFDGYTDELRYQDGVVDRTVHSNETLQYVVSSHLQKRLGNKLERVVGYQGTYFNANRRYPEGYTTVNFALQGGAERTEFVELVYGSRGWGVVEQSTEELMAAVRQLEQSPPAAGHVEKHIPVFLPVAQSDQLVGQRVVVLVRGNKERTGTLHSVTSHTLILRTEIEKGHVDVPVRKRRILSIHRAPTEV